MHYETIFQPERWFFDPAEAPPNKERRAHLCDPKNPANPFSNFVGNQHAVRRLCRVAFQAMAKHNHECSDQSFALIGPASTGKATLARMFAQLVGLPFVEIDARSCNDLNDVVVGIAQVLKETNIANCKYPTLELQDLGDGEIVIPPAIVLFHETQAFPRAATRALHSAFNGHCETNGFTIDTTAICWFVTATDAESMVGLSDRFVKRQLKQLGLEEIARLVAINNLDFSADVCQVIAQYADSPGDALSLAREVRLEQEMSDGTWEQAATAVAQDWKNTILPGDAPWINRIRRHRRN